MDDKVFNRFVVHVDSSLASYSLDILARIAHGQAQDLSEQQLRTQQSLLEASLEKISGVDTNVLFCNHVDVGGRSLLIYSSKRLLSTSLSMKVLEAVPASEIGQAKKNSVASSQVRFFRPLGDTGYVPKDAYDVVSLSKTIGICTTDGIVMADPTNLAKSTVGLVPDFRDAGISPQMAALKTRVEGLKPLGFVRVDANELLVVYDELGCYINKRGIPTRSSSFVKWEIKAVSYAYRSGLLLLICPEFIEVRNVTTGRILQVIEGRNMRLVYSEPYTTKDYPILIAMRGGKDDKNGVSDRIAELIETEEISVMSPSSAITTASIWDEWDM